MSLDRATPRRHDSSTTLLGEESDNQMEGLSLAPFSAKELAAVHAAPSTVLIVGTNHINCLGLHVLLAEHPGLELLNDVQQPDLAVGSALCNNPDLIIIDATVAGIDIVALTRTLRRASPTSRIAAVGTQETLHGNTFRRLMDLGVRGYFLWDRLSRDTVLLCLAVVLVGDLVVGHHMLLDELQVTSEHPRSLQGDEVSLTGNEQMVLTLLTGGLTEKEIAREIPMSEATVRRIIALLRTKFRAASTYALCAQAGRRGFVS